MVEDYLRNIGPIRIRDGLVLFLRYLNGVMFGGIAGFLLHRKYEQGLLLQREASRMLSILGMQHDIFLRMLLFIMVFAFIGAYIEKKLRGK